jgi:hypothetical protein
MSDILEAVEAAILRITSGQAPMRIPAEPAADPDLVLARCGMEIRSLRAKVEELTREREVEREAVKCDVLEYRGILASTRREASKQATRAEQAEAKLAEAQALAEDFRIKELAAQHRWVQAEAKLATEEAERIRCRDGWAKSEAKLASTEANRAAEQATVKELHERLAAVVQWLTVVLDETDYTAKACAPTEMVGAVLPREVIQSARAALAAAREQPTQEKLPLGHEHMDNGMGRCGFYLGGNINAVSSYCMEPESAHQPTQEKPSIHSCDDPNCAGCNPASAYAAPTGGWAQPTQDKGESESDARLRRVWNVGKPDGTDA